MINLIKEIGTVLIATLVLAFTISFNNNSILLYSIISFFIIISLTASIKKMIGHLLEIDVQTKFWSIYQWGFRKDAHFKTPTPLLWVPLIISLFSKGLVWWLAILEFEVNPKTERVSKRHGLYRFTQVTEWHIAWIAVWGIITNIILSILGYLSGFELFARLNIYYALWSLVPISNLDGSKIFFSSRGLWTTIASITLILFIWAKVVI